ncbi:ubiquitin carboxyl-terminal hydrolase 12-like [Pyrus ussuriensis x Pyrus communis]|uniref:Ubiquitin carboxyl-terminal hydrolase 12-like n=1 Tax=Pyrus ussuriensis x Pyrus communis TaxID=2448454 RepID=A0A5N5GDE1_9ROSA|nr:ubiquitin carboxyl-terminal hydrolase 12-like [Pyrus ussuriensis x Pyrus communis]
MRDDGFELDETTLATVLGSAGTWGIDCFVSHHLSVVNQRIEEKSVTNESQNREDATMVTVVGYYDVNTVEVNLVTTGGRENEKV